MARGCNIGGTVQGYDLQVGIWAGRTSPLRLQMWFKVYLVSWGTRI